MQKVQLSRVWPEPATFIFWGKSKTITFWHSSRGEGEAEVNSVLSGEFHCVGGSVRLGFIDICHFNSF